MNDQEQFCNNLIGKILGQAIPKSHRCLEEENEREKGKAMLFEFTTWPLETEPSDGALRQRVGNTRVPEKQI